MAPRSLLQTALEGLIAGEGKVYFQPPRNTKLVYPCIRYERDNADTKFADNLPYTYRKRYLVTVITRDPDSGLPDKVSALPSCTFNRFFAADDLNHDVFTLYH